MANSGPDTYSRQISQGRLLLFALGMLFTLVSWIVASSVDEPVVLLAATGGFAAGALSVILGLTINQVASMCVGIEQRRHPD